MKFCYVEEKGRGDYLSKMDKIVKGIPRLLIRIGCSHYLQDLLVGVMINYSVQLVSKLL